MSEPSDGFTDLFSLLDQLLEPGDPPPVSMMPQTWGWAVVALISLTLIIVAGGLLLRRYRANAYRRAALGQLNSAGGRPEVLAEILRRTALTAYPRREVAGLNGQSWLNFLKRTASRDLFEGAIGETLLQAPYRDLPPSADLQDRVARWIRGHRREGAVS